jgi:hypothetical protein
MASPKSLTVEFTTVEAAALIKAAETGVAVIEALGLVQNTTAMEVAIRKLRAVRPARREPDQGGTERRPAPCPSSIAALANVWTAVEPILNARSPIGCSPPPP